MHMDNTLKGTNVEFNKNTKQKIIKINSGYFLVPPRMPKGAGEKYNRKWKEPCHPNHPCGPQFIGTVLLGVPPGTVAITACHLMKCQYEHWDRMFVYRSKHRRSNE
jgi:hypothetical protein